MANGMPSRARSRTWPLVWIRSIAAVAVEIDQRDAESEDPPGGRGQPQPARRVAIDARADRPGPETRSSTGRGSW